MKNTENPHGEPLKTGRAWKARRPLKTWRTPEQEQEHNGDSQKPSTPKGKSGVSPPHLRRFENCLGTRGGAVPFGRFPEISILSSTKQALDLDMYYADEKGGFALCVCVQYCGWTTSCTTLKPRETIVCWYLQDNHHLRVS